jgi:hypothetical protein
MVEEVKQAAEAAVKEPKISLAGSAKAGAAVNKAERQAAKELKKDAKKTVEASSEKLVNDAREAIGKDHKLVQNAVETGGKELTGIRSLIFKMSNTRLGGLIVRNPKKSIALGIAALGTLVIALRSRRKELPPEEQLMPQIPAMAPAAQLDGPVDGFAADKWQSTVRPGAAAPTVGAPGR